MAGRGAALFKVALVIFLGAIEWSRRRDFRSDGPAEFAAGLQRSLGFFSDGFLLRRMEEDRGPVLRAEIGALAVHLRGIVHLPESVEQLRIAELRRVEGDLHDLGVSGFVCTHILVRWILGVTAAITHDGVSNPRDSAKCRFDPPKASGSKSCDFGHDTAPVRFILSELSTLFDANRADHDSRSA